MYNLNINCLTIYAANPCSGTSWMAAIAAVFGDWNPNHVFSGLILNNDNGLLAPADMDNDEIYYYDVKIHRFISMYRRAQSLNTPEGEFLQ